MKPDASNRFPALNQGLYFIEFFLTALGGLGYKGYTILRDGSLSKFMKLAFAQQTGQTDVALSE